MKTWKAFLALGLVFLAGIILGVVGTRVVAAAYIHRVAQNPSILRAQVERELTRKLRLDADQRAFVHEQLLETHRKIFDLRRQIQPGMSDILTEARTNISAKLNERQKERFEEICHRYAFISGTASTNSIRP